MGNNPITYSDPEGDFLPALIWAVSIGISAYQGYSIAKANGATGMGQFAGALLGGVVGALGGVAGGIVSKAALGATSSLGVIGSNVVAGMAGGAVGGGLSGAGMAALGKQNVGHGFLQGALWGGVFGGVVGLGAGIYSRIKLGKVGPIDDAADDLGKTDFEYTSDGDESTWTKRFDLPDDQGFGDYNKYNYRKSLIKSTGGVDPGKDVHAHHIFVEKFSEDFAKKGINIHHPRNMAWWSVADGHLQKAYAYNKAWESVINSPNWSTMTTQQVYTEGFKIMKQFYPANFNIGKCYPVRF